MKHYFVTAETRDGENEYTHQGVVSAIGIEEAEEETKRKFSYDYCPPECSGIDKMHPKEDCYMHSGEYRITTVGKVQEITKAHYDVLKIYL